ncbi:MAG TPA: sigma-54 dependent transcriptional regulator [Thermoanaerobaculia bacterium]|jgi:DNA-binding NtrC family response regulator|nr:sigma-54 dependent transcriptional regulator [Thermoanaerobaculia bacterium]
MAEDRILVVEDEPVVRFGIRDFLENRGFVVQEAANLEQARALFQRERPDAAVVDYSLPDGNALDLLTEIHGVDPQLPVVVLTGHGTIDLAVRAIKEGAENFLTKPVELPALAVVLERALENQRNRRRQAARQSRRSRDEVDPFAGTSAAVGELAREAAMALRSEGPILIQGETGSGKGVLARWLHEQGARRDEPFVDLNCAGLSREFLESELFGHARGAFTGAVNEKKGLFEVAHRGTLFLDEMGDLDPAVQPKVLKVIEDKRFRRLGETADRQVDVFLIAASNQELASLVRSGQFRSDLFFRISTIPLAVPPLRVRREDIAPLALRLLDQLGRDLGRPGARLAPEALDALRSYSWPGNVRELRNVLERAVLRAEGGEIRPSDFRFASILAESPALSGGQTLVELEKQQIEKVLREERGRVVAAAQRLGIPRSTLYQKIKELRVDLSRFQS